MAQGEKPTWNSFKERRASTEGPSKSKKRSAAYYMLARMAASNTSRSDKLPGGEWPLR